MLAGLRLAIAKQFPFALCLLALKGKSTATLYIYMEAFTNKSI